MKKPTRDNKGLHKPGKKRFFPKVALNDRDSKILQLVYEHRFLDTEILWYLLKGEPVDNVEYKIGKDGKRRPTHYGFGQKALYKRLQILTESKHLNRHYASDQPIGRGHGVPRAIYGLGIASASILTEIVGISTQEVRKIVDSNRVKSLFLRHALEVARFRALLELACRKSENRIHLLFWEQGQILQDWVSGEDEHGDERSFSIYPDAFFALEVEGKGRAHYFLEIDRGTMPITATGNRSDIRKKVFAYYLYRKHKKYSRRYRYRTQPDGTIVGLDITTNGRDRASLKQARFEPIRSFRVLFVAPGTSKAVLSMKGRIANIISAFPTFGKQFATTTLFWFSSFDLFSFEHPEIIFNRVWLTPNPEKQHRSLIE